MTATGLLLLMVSAGSLSDGCLIGPANCALLEQRETERILRCLRYGQAHSVLTSACEQGQSLINGLHGTKRDERRGAELAARACRLGLVQACRQAARLFRSGHGEIEIDERRAQELMELGCPPGRDPCRP